MRARGSVVYDLLVRFDKRLHVSCFLCRSPDGDPANEVWKDEAVVNVFHPVGVQQFVGKSEFVDGRL